MKVTAKRNTATTYEVLLQGKVTTTEATVSPYGWSFPCTTLMLEPVKVFLDNALEVINSESIAWTSVVNEDGCEIFKQHITLVRLMEMPGVREHVKQAIAELQNEAGMSEVQVNESGVDTLNKIEEATLQGTAKKVMSLYQVEVTPSSFDLTDECRFIYRESCGPFKVWMDAEFNVANPSDKVSLVIAHKVYYEHATDWKEHIVTMCIGTWLLRYPILRAQLADIIDEGCEKTVELTAEQKADLIELALATKDKALFEELTEQ